MMELFDSVIVVFIVIMVMCVQVGYKLKRRLNVSKNDMYNLLFLSSLYIVLIVGLIKYYST